MPGARSGSDLDFVVELSEKSFDAYMDTKIFLEDLFQSRVDLVTINPSSRASCRLSNEKPSIPRDSRVYLEDILEATRKIA